MDKFRIIVIMIGAGMIIMFSLYSFGSYLSSSYLPKIGTKVEPKNNSILNVDSTSNKSIQMVAYQNRERPENFYSIQFPSYANVLHGNQSGSYTAKLPHGIFSVELVDIPDTSNVELNFLTKVKPALESSVRDFHQISFNPLSIGGSRAWDLTYAWKNSTTEMESSKIFVEGADMAAAITYSGLRQQLMDHQDINSTVIQPVLQSFHWIVK